MYLMMIRYDDNDDDDDDDDGDIDSGDTKMPTMLTTIPRAMLPSTNIRYRLSVVVHTVWVLGIGG